METIMNLPCQASPAAGRVQRHPRFRHAEVDAHHNGMLIKPEPLTSALDALG
jgi:hypothetical protein